MATMHVRSFMAVAPTLPAWVSIMVRGAHGIGKSALGRWLARNIADREKLDNYEFIDRRLSQMSEGDVIGLPSTDGNTTRFNPPDWYKRACERPCFLLLDELNRATPEVMQAAFQIVLDRELNGWRLHPQTRVMTAINSSAAYNVNEVDPALLDRFWVIDLTPDVQDWLLWGRAPCDDPNPQVQEIKKLFGGFNCPSEITDFIAHEEKWLDPPKDADHTSVHVSRRSWERLGDSLALSGLLEQPESPLFFDTCVGFIGAEASIKFVEFVKTQDNRFTGKDIVDRYAKVRNKIVSKGRVEILNAAIDKASEHARKLGKLTDVQGKNLAAFMKDLPAELKITFWAAITQDGIDKLELAKSAHKHLAEQVIGVFGVPMGDAGIGMMPTIPGMFKKDDKKDAK